MQKCPLNVWMAPICLDTAIFLDGPQTVWTLQSFFLTYLHYMTCASIIKEIKQENDKEYKAVVPKALVPMVLKEMLDRFGHFGTGKTYSLIKRHYTTYSKAH